MNKNPNDSKNELKTNFPNKFKYYFTVYRILSGTSYLWRPRDFYFL